MLPNLSNQNLMAEMMAKTKKVAMQKEMTPDALKDAGNKAFKAKDYKEAVRQYTLAINQKENHIYYSNRAGAYLELKRYQECIDDCLKSIALDPTFAKSYYRHARALIALGRNVEALEVLDKGLEKDPGNDVMEALRKTISEEAPAIDPNVDPYDARLMAEILKYNQKANQPAPFKEKVCKPNKPSAAWQKPNVDYDEYKKLAEIDM